MNVVFVVPAFLPEGFGGAEQQTRKLAGELSRRGVGVTILAPRLQPDTPKDSTDGGVVVHRFRLSHPPSHGGRHILSWLWWSVRVSAWLALHRGRYDVIHVIHGRLHAVPAIVTGHLLRIPTLVKLGRGGDHFDLRLVAKKRLIGRWMAPMVVNLPSCFIANSAEIVQDLHAFGIAPERIRLLPNGVQTLPPRQHRDDSDRPVQFLYVGRFDVEKSLARMIRDFSRLPDGTRATLTLVGAGACESELRELVATLGAGDRIFIKPPVADVIPLFAQADFYVSTSTSEGMSNSLLEAMSASVPPITSRVSGVDDIVDEGRSGLIFDAADPDGFVRALAEAVAIDADRWNQMSAAAHATTVARFSMQAVTAAHEDLYRALSAAPSERWATS